VKPGLIEKQQEYYKLNQASFKKQNHGKGGERNLTWPREKTQERGIKTTSSRDTGETSLSKAEKAVLADESERTHVGKKETRT